MSCHVKIHSCQVHGGNDISVRCGLQPLGTVFLVEILDEFVEFIHRGASTLRAAFEVIHTNAAVIAKSREAKPGELTSTS